MPPKSRAKANAAASGDAKVLSSNDLNARLKAKDYAALLGEVSDHFGARPEDVISAGKFLTAMAFHLYYNRMEEAAAIKLAERCSAEAVAVLARGRPDAEVAKKALTAANNLVFRGFLRDGWTASAASVVKEVVALLDKLGEEALARFFAQLLKLLEGPVSEALSRLEGEASKEIKAVLRSKEMMLESVPLRTLGLHKARLEVQYVALRHSRASEEGVARICEACQAALDFVQANSASAEVVLQCDRVFVMVGKFDDLLAYSGWARDRLAVQMTSVRKLVLALRKSQKAFVPSSRSLKVWCHLFEKALEQRDREDAESLLDELLTLVDCSEEDNPVSNVMKAFLLHGRFRLRYQDLRWTVEAEEVSRAAAAAPHEAETEADAIKDVGDVNPYASLTKEAEEEMVGHLREACDFVGKAFDGKQQLPFQIVPVLYIVQSSAEFFSLSGYSELCRSACLLLLKLSTVHRMDKFACMALSNLLTSNFKVDKEIEDVISRAKKAIKSMGLQGKSVKEISARSIQVLTATAWQDFHVRKTESSFKICRSLLQKLFDADESLRSGTAHKALIADLLTLMAHLRSCPGAFIKCPSSCGDQFEEMGPLDCINEAYRFSASAVSQAAYFARKPKWLNLPGLSDLLSTSRIHHDVLTLRYDLSNRVKMPKEMRLFSKMTMEFAKTCALTMRTAEGLLRMVEVDLLSEEGDQAVVKLRSVQKLLGTAMDVDEQKSASDKANKRRNGKVLLRANHNLGASPAVKQPDVAELPAWADSHDRTTCQCHECLTLGPSHLACYNFVNLQGVASHSQGDSDAAARHFDCASRLASILESRSSSSSDGGKMQLAVARTQVDGLQWQFECYGRDRRIAKCKQCLAEQARVMRTVPGLSSEFSGGILGTRMAHSALFLQLEDPLDLSHVEEQLSKVTFLSPMPRGSPASSLLAPEISPSNFKTPAPPTDAEAKGRTTRAGRTAVKGAPRKKLVPKPIR